MNDGYTHGTVQYTADAKGRKTGTVAAFKFDYQCPWILFNIKESKSYRAQAFSLSLNYWLLKNLRHTHYHTIMYCANKYAVTFRKQKSTW